MRGTITLVNTNGEKHSFYAAKMECLGGEKNDYYYKPEIGFFRFLEKTAINNTAKIDVIANAKTVASCMVNSRIGGKSNYVVALSTPDGKTIEEYLFNRDNPIPTDWLSFDTVKQEFFLRASSTNYATLVASGRKPVRSYTIADFTRMSAEVLSVAKNGDYDRIPQNMGHVLEVLHCKGTTIAEKLSAWCLKDATAKYDGQLSYYTEDGKRHCLTVDFKCAVSVAMADTTKKKKAYGNTHGIKYTCFMPTFLLG